MEKSQSNQPEITNPIPVDNFIPVDKLFTKYGQVVFEMSILREELEKTTQKLKMAEKTIQEMKKTMTQQKG